MKSRATISKPRKPSHAPAKSVGLALTPHGTLHLESVAVAAGDSDWDADAQRAVIAAFERGTGDGLFELAARYPHATVPPVFARWRDFARIFLVHITMLPDSAAKAPAPTLTFAEASAALWLKGAPLMPGAEYLTIGVLRSLWREMNTVFQRERRLVRGDLQTFLQKLNPIWNQVGRIYLHLGENPQFPETPFTFLATYTPEQTAGTPAPHWPLSRALSDRSRSRNKSALATLLRPLNNASAASPWFKELVDSGRIYRPLGWTADQAYRFLQEVPTLEASGLMIRVPDWWKAGAPPRVKIRVSVGQQAILGKDTLVDFDAALTLDGEPLTPEEWTSLLATTQRLVQIRGHWVELDSEKLRQALAQWEKLRQREGRSAIGLMEAMRLLAGAPVKRLGTDVDAAAPYAEWTEVIAGPGISEALNHLNHPDTLPTIDRIPGFKGKLRPYQKEGVQWLRFLNGLGLGACLADDMGLGKTVQILALLTDLKARGIAGPHLLVLPASLLGNWAAELERFAPGLKTLTAHASALPMSTLTTMTDQSANSVDLVLTTYGTLMRLPWLTATLWGTVILDEAQAIKNPEAKQTRTVKRLSSRHRIILTGTPVENSLSDLWSLFDFVCPGLLGMESEFSLYARRLGAGPLPSYEPLRNLVRPYLLRRLKSDPKIISDLPDKTELKVFCGLSPKQAALYQQSVEALTEQIQDAEGIQRKGVILAALTRFKQICNHPSQWLGDHQYAPEDSAKFARLRELCETIAAKREKVLVFTQFREMTDPLASVLEDIFGRPGLVLHGDTPVKNRRGLVQAFQSEDGPPFFVLSLKAGGTGLNLTAAAHVIHFDRWWNPAVENQATDRAYRIGQKQNVLVHKFVCRGTIEEKIDTMIDSKLALSQDLLEGSSEALLTRMSNHELLKTVALDIHRAQTESYT